MVTSSPQIEFSTIDSQSDWRRWYNELDNKTYIIRHDPDIWHRIGPPHRCILIERINRQMNSWGNASKLVRHDSRKQLWATIRLPDHFCVGGGKHLKLKKTECWSCRCRRVKANEPFFDNYPIQDATLTSSEFEKGYILVKFLDGQDKLVVTHFNCSTPKRCLHFRWYLYNRRKKLPTITSKVTGNVIQIVKLL